MSWADNYYHVYLSDESGNLVKRVSFGNTLSQALDEVKICKSQGFRAVYITHAELLSGSWRAKL